MGDINKQFNSTPESRGAGFFPTAKFYIHDIYARALRKLSEGADGVHRGYPYAPFLRNSLGSAKELHNQSPP